MNKYQIKTLIVGVMVITASILYPTWVFSVDSIERDTIRGSIYSNDLSIGNKIRGKWIRKYNSNITRKGSNINIYIDYKRTKAEVTIIIILIALIIFLLNDSTLISKLDKK